MLKTYKGSCHCGAVQFETDLDLERGTGKCNCSFCTKARFWGAQIKPTAFRVTAGEHHVRDYQFNTKSQHHFFCPSCGVAVFGKGYVEENGGDYVSVSLACLDDADPSRLAEAPVRYFNGRDNAWWDEPAEVRHL
jgi:hypothetical protein